MKFKNFEKLSQGNTSDIVQIKGDFGDREGGSFGSGNDTGDNLSALYI